MKYGQSGSATLIVLILMTALLAWGVLVWQSIARMQDIVTQARVYEQKKWKEFGVLEYGIALASQNFNTILLLCKMDPDGSWSTAFDTTKLIFRQKGHALVIEAPLVACTVMLQSDKLGHDSIIVSDWMFHYSHS